MKRPWLWFIVERRLTRRLPPEHSTAVLGDLVEDYRADRAKRGAWRAEIRFLAEARSLAKAYRRPTAWSARLNGARQDVRHAIRMFLRQPRFTAVALATLALGIGANVAVFSIARAILLPALPIPDADSVVRVFQSRADRSSGSGGDTSPGLFRAWQDGTREIFAAVSAYRWIPATLSGVGDATRLSVVEATPEIFDVMGAPLASGRPFSALESARASPVVVISHALWRGTFQSDPAIIGRTIRLDGEPWTVVGVAAEGLSFPASEGADVWRPLVLRPAIWDLKTAVFLDVVGRLRPGVSIAQANVPLDGITASALADGKSKWTAYAEEYRESEVGSYRGRLRLLQGVTAIVLLIASVNLANLLLVSATARRRELAVRASLGAGHGRIARQLVTEGLVLSGAGAAAGVAVAAWAGPALVAAYPGPVPSYQVAGIGVAELALAAGLAIAMACLFSLAPIIAVIRPGAVSGLKDAAGAGSSPGIRFLRAGLVATEVALALALLVGGGLLTRSYWRLTSQPLHFKPENVLVVRVAAADARYPTPEARRQFFAETIAGLGALPGVAASGAATRLPFDGSGAGGSVEADLGDGRTRRIPVSTRTVAGDYFRALGITVVQGRPLASTDDASAEAAVVVSESLARRLDPATSVVGRRLRRQPAAPWMTIVGVAADARSHYRWQMMPDVYFPLGQHDAGDMTIAVRTAGAVESLRAPVADFIRIRDPEIPLGAFNTVEHMISASVGTNRFNLAALVALASLATLLAILGIAGVTAYVIGLRTREIGIRLALGAGVLQVQRMLVRQGLTPIIMGLVLGLAASWWLTALIQSELFEVAPRDPVTLASAAVLFLVVSMAACWWPARRAGRVDPATTLRSE